MFNKFIVALIPAIVAAVDLADDGKVAEVNSAASSAALAAVSGYDNDSWASQANGSDQDSRYGKSYDFIEANEFDDEQYSRKVRADDDQWAENRDETTSRDANAVAAAASQSTA